MDQIAAGVEIIGKIAEIAKSFFGKRRSKLVVCDVRFQRLFISEENGNAGFHGLLAEFTVCNLLQEHRTLLSAGIELRFCNNRAGRRKTIYRKLYALRAGGSGHLKSEFADFPENTSMFPVQLSPGEARTVYAVFCTERSKPQFPEMFYGVWDVEKSDVQDSESIRWRLTKSSILLNLGERVYRISLRPAWKSETAFAIASKEMFLS